MCSVPRHWQVLILAALGIGATLVAVPRALNGIAAVPMSGSDPAISRTGGATQTAKASAATVPAFSAVASATPSVTDTKAPSTVTNLRVVSATDAGAVISWDASSDNVAVRGYVVRCDSTTTVQTSPPATLGWSRRTTPVTVQVAAVDTSGNQSEWRSVVVPAKTVAATQPVTTAPVEPTNTIPKTTAPTTPAVTEPTPTESVPVSVVTTPTAVDTASAPAGQAGATSSAPPA